MELQQDSIEILKNSESFHSWKFELNIHVEAYNLVEVFVEKDPVKRMRQEFVVKDAKVKKLILNSIDRKLKGHLISCTDAKQMYNKLCAMFEGSEERNKSSLLQDFFSFKYQSQSMSQLITDIENLRLRLNNLNHTIDDDMVMSKLLTCLPSEYKYFITAWESSPDEKKTLINLTNRLLSEEHRFLERKDETQQVAFKAGNKNLKCFKCQKPGHLKRDCKMCSICKRFNHVEKDCKFKNSCCPICKKTNHREENCYFKNKENKTKPVSFYTQTFNEVSESVYPFIVDSGSTLHMTNDQNILSNFEETSSSVFTANDAKMQAQGSGIVNGSRCVLKNTLYIPDLAQNLLSVNSVTNNNGSVLFTKDKVEIYQGSNLVLHGKKENGLYTVNIQSNNFNKNKSLLSNKKGTTQEWHAKLGHPGKGILEIITQVADGIEIQGSKILQEQCEVCTKAKQSRLPFNTVRARATRPLEIIHTDVCGPLEVKTYDGFSYILTVMDDYSHFTKIYLLKAKSDVKEKIKNYVEEVERAKDTKVSVIRCDNGGEYTSNDIKSWCLKKGITLDYTVPYSPQLNGKAERLNRTLLEKTRALLFDSDLEKEMWGEAMYCATYILNRLPSDTLKNKTPFEMWFGRKPNISNMQKFGSTVYSKLLHTNIKKLDPRSKKLIMIGYTNNGYRLWNAKERKVEISRDIVIIEDKHDKQEENHNKRRINFDKMVILDKEDETLERQEDVTKEQEKLSNEEEMIEEEKAYLQEQQNYESFEDATSENETEKILIGKDTDNEKRNTEEYNIRKKSERKKQKPAYLKDYALLTYSEVMSSNEKENWEKAIISEKESLKNNNTWEIVDKKEIKGNKILTNKWVFRIKENDVYKARLVVRGFEQHGIDYNEIYSPVVSQPALKSLFAIAASKGYEIMSFDVKTAFLYGELEEEIYMNIPEGYEKQPDKVCRLNKALYGLKQAPITWNKTFTNAMLKLSLIPTKTDQCVFTNNDNTIIIAIYVDDGLAVAKEKQTLFNILQNLEKEFQITICTHPTSFIGFEVTKTEEGILLKQEYYTENLLRKFEMQNSKIANTPCNRDKMTETQNTDTLKFPYRELIGGLLYLSTRSRPDISQAVNKASRKIENPTRGDIIAAKKILKYLNGTRNKGIMYKRDGDITKLNAFCDADYANCIDTRRSTTGFVIMLSEGPVSWCSKRQPIVALSSTEAEYIAAADCCKECLYLKFLLREITEHDVGICLNVDNQSAIQLIKSGIYNKRSKHIDVRYYFIHEKFKKGLLDIKYCPSDQQTADLFTKPLLNNKFNFHCKNIVK